MSTRTKLWSIVLVILVCLGYYLPMQRLPREGIRNLPPKYRSAPSRNKSDITQKRAMLANDSENGAASQAPSEIAKEADGAQCRFKIQVYERNNVVHKTPIMRDVVNHITNGSPTVQCDNNCSVDLVMGDESNKYVGIDAVVFHLTWGAWPLQPYHLEGVNPKLAWVFFSFESPYSTTRQGNGLKQLPVHATWTYHRGSEISARMGFHNAEVPMTNATKSAEEWVQGKTKLVAWVATNCYFASWPRKNFVNELKKHIPVDIYGDCGKRLCKEPSCVTDLVRQYKFYLSVENSECEDYMTEKLWNTTLQNGVVPIVYGPNRKSYEDKAPPNSFIYIGDYKNVKELADYLNLLDSRPELYAKYLEWQYTGSVGYFNPLSPPAFCLVIPVIKKVKSGELVQRDQVQNSKYFQACRKPVNNKHSDYGLGTWSPW